MGQLTWDDMFRQQGVNIPASTQPQPAAPSTPNFGLGQAQFANGGPGNGAQPEQIGPTYSYGDQGGGTGQATGTMPFQSGKGGAGPPSPQQPPVGQQGDPKNNSDLWRIINNPYASNTQGMGQFMNQLGYQPGPPPPTGPGIPNFSLGSINAANGGPAYSPPSTGTGNQPSGYSFGGYNPYGQNSYNPSDPYEMGGFQRFTNQNQQNSNGYQMTSPTGGYTGQKGG